ncbi:hypothetical protein IWW56_004197 [Coemansia sp. RSA 2131]|nr:hypothetical protein IWW56_004197 [Coemansia sp. RSA 2131]
MVRALASKIASDLGEILATAPEEPVADNAMSRAAEGCRSWLDASLTQSRNRRESALYSAHTGFLRFVAYRLEQLSKDAGNSRFGRLPVRFVWKYKPDHNPDLTNKDIRVDCPIYALDGRA